MATKRKYSKRRSSRKIRGGTIFGHSMRVAKAQREKKQKEAAATKRRREKTRADKKARADKVKVARLASSSTVAAEGLSESSVPVTVMAEEEEKESVEE